MVGFSCRYWNMCVVKNRKEVETAFREGKDFLGDFQMGFKLCGISDFKPGDHVNLRYSRNTKMAVITV